MPATTPAPKGMSLKLVVDADTDAILGAQGVGGAGVDKRIDVIATAMRGGLTASDLADLELSYAPQFGSAKDPVNMLGFIAENLRDETHRDHPVARTRRRTRARASSSSTSARRPSTPAAPSTARSTSPSTTCAPASTRSQPTSSSTARSACAATSPPGPSPNTDAGAEPRRRLPHLGTNLTRASSEAH